MKKLRYSKKERERIAKKITREVEKALKAPTIKPKIEIDINDIDMKGILKEDAPEKAILFFSPTAFLKITKYVKELSDKESAWHGTVLKLEKGKYFIEDVMLFPQQVSACTTESDDDEYPKWNADLAMNHEDTYNKLLYHGHSHVRMTTSPSGTDKTHREDMVKDHPDGSFYIFTIHNQSGDIDAEIYDTEDNVLYDNQDITVDVLLDDNTSLADFISEDIEENILSQKQTVIQPTTNYGYYRTKNAKPKINYNKNNFIKEQTKRHNEDIKKTFPNDYEDDLLTEEEYKARYGYTEYYW